MTFDVMIDLLAECENGHELLVTLDAIISQDKLQQIITMPLTGHFLCNNN